MNKIETNVENPPSNEKEINKEKINELLTVINQEIENIHEIIDGGWKTFPLDQSDKRNQIFESLIELRDLTEEVINIKSEKQRHDYQLLQEDDKYLLFLKENLQKIKNTIDQIDFKPAVKTILQKQIQNAIDAYNSLKISE